MRHICVSSSAWANPGARKSRTVITAARKSKSTHSNMTKSTTMLAHVRSQQLGADMQRLKTFLSTATTEGFTGAKAFRMGNGEVIACVSWDNRYYITGTDILRIVKARLEAMGHQIYNRKKFEEGVFSDLRNLKPGEASVLEETQSPFLQHLLRLGCIRTQKKQKVFYWERVDHDALLANATKRHYAAVQRANTEAHIHGAMRAYPPYNPGPLTGPSYAPQQDIIPLESIFNMDMFDPEPSSCSPTEICPAPKPLYSAAPAPHGPSPAEILVNALQHTGRSERSMQQ